MVTVPRLPAIPRRRADGPLHLSPSSGPWRQTRRRDSYPPGINMPCPEIFSKNHSRDNTPRVMGPAPKNYQTNLSGG